SSHYLPRQLVTLAFLSDSLPASLICDRLAESLCSETNAKVLVLRVELQDGATLAMDAAIPDVFLNGEFHLPAEIRKTDGGFHTLTLGVESRPSSPESVESLL